MNRRVERCTTTRNLLQLVVQIQQPPFDLRYARLLQIQFGRNGELKMRRPVTQQYKRIENQVRLDTVASFVECVDDYVARIAVPR